MANLLDYALTTVADVKENLGISSGDHTKDNLIIRKINQATEIIEGYTGRRFKATDYTEYYDGTGTDTLVLKNRPVNSITTLSARSTVLNDADFNDVDTDQYFIDSTAGIINGISTFYGKYDRWKVVYNAGYTVIPSDLAEAAATLAAYLVSGSVDNSSGAAVKRKSEGSRSVEYHDNSSSVSGTSIVDQLNLDETLSRYANTVISGLV